MRGHFLLCKKRQDAGNSLNYMLRPVSSCKNIYIIEEERLCSF